MESRVRLLAISMVMDCRAEASPVTFSKLDVRASFVAPPSELSVISEFLSVMASKFEMVAVSKAVPRRVAVSNDRVRVPFTTAFSPPLMVPENLSIVPS